MQRCDVIIAQSDKAVSRTLNALLAPFDRELNTAVVCQTVEELLNNMECGSKMRIVFAEYGFMNDKNFKYAMLNHYAADCKLILIEREHNFDNLLSAMRSGVFDVLYLPLDANEVNDSLERALNNLQGIEFAGNMRRNLLWRYDLHRLPSSTMTIPQINASYGTHFEKGLFRAFFIELTSLEDQTVVFQNRDMQDFVMRMCNVSLQEACYDILYNRHTNGVSALINYAASQNDKISQQIEQLFFELQREFREVYHVLVTMAVSHQYDEIRKLPEMKNEVLDARWYRKKLGSADIIHADDVEQMQPMTRSQQRALQNAWDLVVHYYEVLDLEHAILSIKQFFSVIKDVVSPHQARLYIRQLLTLLFEKYENELLIYGDKETMIQKYIYQQASAVNNAQLEQGLIASVTELMQKITVIIKRQYSQPIRECMAYIANHYSEKIRLQTLAELCGLSPQYLSNLFHRETGQTISEFITAQKLETAQGMLKYSNKKIYEIADALGFEDAHYFSKFFRKHLHLTPKEYRRLEHAKEARRVDNSVE